jgi:hypothetical protein
MTWDQHSEFCSTKETKAASANSFPNTSWRQMLGFGVPSHAETSRTLWKDNLESWKQLRKPFTGSQKRGDCRLRMTYPVSRGWLQYPGFPDGCQEAKEQQDLKVCQGLSIKTCIVYVCQMEMPLPDWSLPLFLSFGHTIPIQQCHSFSLTCRGDIQEPGLGQVICHNIVRRLGKK